MTKTNTARVERTGEGDCSAPTVDQIAIAFGKWMAGYRKGDELWNDLDQQAVDYVMAGSFIKPNDSDDRRSPLYPIVGQSGGQA